uniref:hypothetical protein n=1 Tax=Amycolatopsis sp. CA-082387 TaxID=3239918 RepID=UPI003F4923A9
MNYPTYDQQPVVIDDGCLTRSVEIVGDTVRQTAGDPAALDLADIRSVRDDVINHGLDDPEGIDDLDGTERDLRIALLSLLAAEKAFAFSHSPDCAAAAAGLRAQTAFLLNTVHG